MPADLTAAAPFSHANWLAGLEIREPELYDKGYWDKANGYHKDSALAHHVDYQNGWEQAKYDTK